MPSPVPRVLESSIKLSENFVIVCVCFSTKDGKEWGKKNQKGRLGGKVGEVSRWE